MSLVYEEIDTLKKKPFRKIPSTESYFYEGILLPHLEERKKSIKGKEPKFQKWGTCDDLVRSKKIRKMPSPLSTR